MKAATLTNVVDNRAKARAEMARQQAAALDDLRALIEIGRLAGLSIEQDTTPPNDGRSYPNEEFGRYFDLMRRIYYDGHLLDVRGDLAAACPDGVA